METKQKIPLYVYFTHFELCMVFANQLCKVYLCKCVCVCVPACMSVYLWCGCTSCSVCVCVCVFYGPG